MRRSSHWVPLLALDAVLVTAFAAIGRQSHEHGLSVVGILQTAAPFLVALVVSSAAARVWSQPSRVVPHGLVVWIGTVCLGLALRVAAGATAALPFVIVATVTLGVLLLGRRAVTSRFAGRGVRARGTVN
ncbi:DUF3054 domain-containing protein [Arthrobacter halodurans]|uniref:DUF3054 domain-containing protein n=1 Tax=Arthrobacter halodurans TaxID=516699 RepID=A0ABV4UNK8_9MICC